MKFAGQFLNTRSAGKQLLGAERGPGFVLLKLALQHPKNASRQRPKQPIYLGGLGLGVCGTWNPTAFQAQARVLPCWARVSGALCLSTLRTTLTKGGGPCALNKARLFKCFQGDVSWGEKEDSRSISLQKLMNFKQRLKLAPT